MLTICPEKSVVNHGEIFTVTVSVVDQEEEPTADRTENMTLFITNGSMVSFEESSAEAVLRNNTFIPQFCQGEFQIQAGEHGAVEISAVGDNMTCTVRIPIRQKDDYDNQ